MKQSPKNKSAVSSKERKAMKLNLKTGRLVEYSNAFVTPQHIEAWHAQTELLRRMYVLQKKKKDEVQAAHMLKRLRAAYASLANQNRGRRQRRQRL